MRSWRYYQGHIFWFFANPIRKLYRYIFRPTGRGVKVLILKGDSVLLIRPTYGHKQWTIPGGNVERRETPLEAGKREVREEVALVLDELVPIGEFPNMWDYRRDVVSMFVAHVGESGGVAKADRVEIEEAKWFPLDALPPDRVSRVDKVIEAYRITSKAGI